MCHGSGNRAKWVGLRELSDLLERAIAMEPDYAELAREMEARWFSGSNYSIDFYVQPATIPEKANAFIFKSKHYGSKNHSHI